jgi:hypothetical protein
MLPPSMFFNGITHLHLLRMMCPQTIDGQLVVRSRCLSLRELKNQVITPKSKLFWYSYVDIQCVKVVYIYIIAIQANNKKWNKPTQLSNQQMNHP